MTSRQSLAKVSAGELPRTSRQSLAQVSTGERTLGKTLSVLPVEEGNRPAERSWVCLCRFQPGATRDKPSPLDLPHGDHALPTREVGADGIAGDIDNASLQWQNFH